jgi:hypothetical protein
MCHHPATCRGDREYIGNMWRCMIRDVGVIDSAGKLDP